MTAFPAFANWTEEIHNSADQQKRIESAQKARTSPATIDRESKTATFKGSGAMPYQTTLESCTCIDFVRRKLPCKHMYRLAIELGMLGDDVKKTLRVGVQISLEEAVAELENLTEDAQLIVSGQLYRDIYQHEVNLVALMQPVYAELKNSRLFEPVPEPWEAVAALTKAEFVSVLDIAGASGYKKSLSKLALIEWAKAERPDVLDSLFVMRLSSHIQQIRRSLYTYLNRKFEDDSELILGEGGCFREAHFPHGAKPDIEQPFVFYFPEDRVTKLLTLYGHNRCEGGFDILTGKCRGERKAKHIYRAKKAPGI